MTVAVNEAEAREWAESVTKKIHASIIGAREQVQIVEDLLKEAQEGDAASILGYKSWTEYVSDIFAQTPLRLAREDREAASKMLSRYGMSTRAIAPILGTSPATVARDVAEDGSTVSDETVGTVTGLDGRTYTKPEKAAEEPVDKPVKARRTAIAKAAREAAATITAGLDLLESILADDRYKANREQVRSELHTVIQRCDDLYGKLESEDEETESA